MDLLLSPSEMPWWVISRVEATKMPYLPHIKESAEQIVAMLKPGDGAKVQNYFTYLHSVITLSWRIQEPTAFQP